MTDRRNSGHLSFYLPCEQLRGGYALTRIREGKDETWLLIKRKDAFKTREADARRKPLRTQPESVLSGRALADMDELP